jgi:chromosome segregation ATPase
MTLPERCRNLRAQIDQRNELRRAHHDANAFRERTGEFLRLRTQVSSDLARLLVLKKKSVAIGKLPALTGALEQLEECKRALAANPTESGRDFGLLKRSVDKVRKGLESAIESSLQSVNRDLPSIEESFLKLVELIPGHLSRVARIREERDRLHRGTNLESMTAEELEEFLDRRDALKELADQLNPTEFPKEVLEFFKAARRGGAPLDKFSASVQAWLSQQGLLTSIRIVIQN